MFANIRVVLELLKLLWETYQWVGGKIDDITYYGKRNARKKLIEAIGSGNEQDELDALEELGK